MADTTLLEPTETITEVTPEAAAAPVIEAPALEELLVEEVSIDGMCGVY